MKLEKNENDKPLDNRVTDKEVEEAFVNIIKWIICPPPICDSIRIHRFRIFCKIV